MRKLLIAMVVLILLAGAVAFLLGDRLASRFTTEGRRQRMLSRLHDDEILVRRSCGVGEAYVDAGRWRGLSDSDRQRAADAIAAYCASQGGGNTLTVLDAESRAVLGRWDGAALTQ